MQAGQAIDIYENYQEETKPFGKALILEEKAEGLTFILDEMPKEKQIVYGTKRFFCEILESDVYPVGFKKTFNKRYIHTIGVLTSNIDEEELDNSDYYTRPDSFLEVDGEQIF